MIKTTKDLMLPTTIPVRCRGPRGTPRTSARGRSGTRSPTPDFASSTPMPSGPNLRDQERAGLDIVTDGDARFDTDVGGMSWFQYPARRFKGLAGGDYHRVRKGYGGTAQGRHHLRGDGEPRDAALRRQDRTRAAAVHVRCGRWRRG